MDGTLLLELRSSSTSCEVEEEDGASLLPRAALRLHGVIHIRRLPASTGSAQKVLRNIRKYYEVMLRNTVPDEQVLHNISYENF
jgi:hypothetical protein